MAIVGWKSSPGGWLAASARCVLPDFGMKDFIAEVINQILTGPGQSASGPEVLDVIGQKLEDLEIDKQGLIDNLFGATENADRAFATIGKLDQTPALPLFQVAFGELGVPGDLPDDFGKGHIIKAQQLRQ